MRQGMAGLVAGLVIGSVLASGAAFALDTSRAGARDVPATPKVQAVVSAWRSTAATRSAQATKPAGTPAVENQARKAPAKASIAAKHVHSSTCAHSVGGQHHHAVRQAPTAGTVTAVPRTCDQQARNHDGRERCN